MIRRDVLIGRVRASTLVRGVRDVFAMTTPQERVQAGLLVVSMIVSGLLNIIGIAGVVPFMAIMISPDPFAGSGIIARTARELGLTDVGAALTLIGLALIVLVLAKNLYGLFHSVAVNRYCSKFEQRLTGELLDRVIAAPYAWLVTRNATVLRDVITGHAVEISRSILRGTLQLGTDLFFLLLAAVMLLIASPLPGLLVSTAALVIAAALMAVTREPISRAGENKRAYGRLIGVTSTEAIAGGRDVRMSNAGAMLSAMFRREFQQYSNADVHGRFWLVLPRLGIELIVFTALVGIALIALWSGQSRVEVGTLLALYAVVAMRALPLISQMVGGVSALRATLPVVAEVKSLIDELPPVDRAARHGAGRPPLDWRSVTLDAVTVQFKPDALPALKNVSLRLERNRSYGIVGMSGAGKSTLVDVLSGLLTPNSGVLLVDGAPIAADDAPRWRERVAYVAQTPFLLDATIAENIVFGPTEGDGVRRRLLAAIARAGLDGFVSCLPDGVDTRVGDRGVQLSGGQRQRIVIARALFRDADLLVLDEATSALDSLTEREIQTSIEALAGELTLVVIAHRLSTIANCDEIILLDQGRVAGRGTHSQLARESELYRRLSNAQLQPLES